jgi:hypothetical protein
VIDVTETVPLFAKPARVNDVAVAVPLFANPARVIDVAVAVPLFASPARDKGVGAAVPLFATPALFLPLDDVMWLVDLADPSNVRLDRAAEAAAEASSVGTGMPGARVLIHKISGSLVVVAPYP